MADLSSLTYSSLQTAVGDWLARSDLSANIPDFITLFEAEANRTLRTRQMENTVLLYPSAGNQMAVTNAVSNGAANLIRLTVTSTTTHAAPTGEEIFVANVGGTVEANNTWIATQISSLVYDLQQSAFVNAYTSGGTITEPSGVAPLPSDFLTQRRVTWSGVPNKEMEYVQPSILRIYHPIIANVNLILDQDFPSMFTIEGGNIICRPIDQTALEFDYYQKIPSLASAATSGSSTNWLLTNYPDLYLAGSLTEAYVFQKDWDQAGMWKQRRDDIFERITRLDQKFRGPSAVKPDMRGIIP